jgi:uncharacterized protein
VGGLHLIRHHDDLIELIAGDSERMRILSLVRSLALPDCWIGAGFLRSAVWDHLHGRALSPPSGDVDVVWFDPARASAAIDEAAEAELRRLDTGIEWSVKNQARMNERNGDRAYISASDAMRFWPETAGAIGISLNGDGGLEIAAPCGLDDLFALVLRPTERFRLDKRTIFLERIMSKRWLETWPLLRVELEPA